MRVVLNPYTGELDLVDDSGSGSPGPRGPAGVPGPPGLDGEDAPEPPIVANITSPSSSGGTCVNSPELLCRGGRAGTANDAIGSTDQAWTLQGSSAALGALVTGMRLRASASVAGLISLVDNSILMAEPLTAFGLGGGIAWRDATGGFRTLILGGAQAADITYILPTSLPGGSGQALLNGGGGALTWGTPTIGCANAPDLLCLDGRTGTTNDPTISTDADGTVLGSLVDGKQLILNANPNAVGLIEGEPMVVFCKNLDGGEVHSLDTPTCTLAGVRPRASYDLFADGGFLEMTHISAGGLHFIQDDTGGIRVIANRSNTTVRNANGVDCLNDNEFFLYQPQSPEGESGAKIIADGATLHFSRVSGQPTHFALSCADSGVIEVDVLECFPAVIRSEPATGSISVADFQPYRVDAEFDVLDDGACFDVFNLTANTFTAAPKSFRSRVPGVYMTHAGEAIFGTVDGVPDTTNGNVMELEREFTLSANIGDGQAAGLVLDPAYAGSSTVTRHNYIKVEDVGLASGAAVTDGCVLWFDAAAGTHKAVDAHAGAGTPTLGVASAPVTGDPDAWVKINVNGTVMYMPAWA